MQSRIKNLIESYDFGMLDVQSITFDAMALEGPSSDNYWKVYQFLSEYLKDNYVEMIVEHATKTPKIDMKNLKYKFDRKLQKQKLKVIESLVYYDSEKEKIFAKIYVEQKDLLKAKLIF